MEKDYLEALESGQSSLGRGFKGVIQTLDRVMEQIQRGDYGYAGLMDRKRHIREDGLARAFDYDKELAGEISKLEGAVEAVHSSVMGKDWEAVPDQLNLVRDALEEVERSWREREKCFRSLEV